MVPTPMEQGVTLSWPVLTGIVSVLCSLCGFLGFVFSSGRKYARLELLQSQSLEKQEEMKGSLAVILTKVTSLGTNHEVIVTRLNQLTTDMNSVREEVKDHTARLTALETRCAISCQAEQILRQNHGRPE